MYSVITVETAPSAFSHRTRVVSTARASVGEIRKKIRRRTGSNFFRMERSIGIIIPPTLPSPRSFTFSPAAAWKGEGTKFAASAAGTGDCVPASPYDVIVLGAGPAGSVCAIPAAQL